MSGLVAKAVQRAVTVREEETAALVWSCSYFFFVLCAYYVIRPIRDEMGVAGGVDNIPWLFTGTLLGMLLVHPLYTAAVGRLPRRRFVPWTYRFFIVNLVVFFLLFHAANAVESVWLGRIFFIWVSVFNLFVISVFWSFMADIYRPEQSKRLFGAVAVGGTMGAILGSSITSFLVEGLGTVNLLLVSALLLEIAARASNVLGRHEGRLARAASEDGGPRGGEDAEAGAPPPGAAVGAGAGEAARGADGHGSEIIGGGVLDGIRHVLKSPYLLGIAAFMLLYTIASTFLYIQQADIVVNALGDDSEARTRLFANIDLAVNVLTLGTQVFLTGRILRWLGVAVTLALLPLVSMIGFVALGAAPVLVVLVVFQVLRRAGNYAVARPTREVLYTVLPRTDKYKAKNFNDTFVYRVGDQVGAWSYNWIGMLGLGVSGLAFTMVPLCALWLMLALWLGWRQREMRETAEAAVAGELAPEPAGA